MDPFICGTAQPHSCSPTTLLQYGVSLSSSVAVNQLSCTSPYKLEPTAIKIQTSPSRDDGHQSKPTLGELDRMLLPRRSLSAKDIYPISHNRSRGIVRLSTFPSTPSPDDERGEKCTTTEDSHDDSPSHDVVVSIEHEGDYARPGLRSR